MKRNLIFVYAMILLICASCQKDIESVSPKEETSNLPQKIKFEEGMLVFKDSADFQEMTSYLCTHNSVFGSSYFDQKPEGFISMMDVYQQVIIINDEKQYANFCANHPAVFCRVGADTSFFYELKIPFLLSMITNENGMLKVGANYVLYSNDYIYKSNNLQSLMSIVNSNFNSIPSEVSRQQTFSNIGLINEKGEYSYKTAYFDNNQKHRIVARLYKYQGDYSKYYYDAKTTAQKKSVIGIWTQEVISMVNASRGSGYIIDPQGLESYNILPLSVTYYNNYSEVMINVASLLYDYANNSSSYCSTTHSGTRDGVTKSITTNDIFF